MENRASYVRFQWHISKLIIEGANITLRLADSSDIETIIEWENDYDNWFVSGTTEPYSRDQIKNFIENDNDIFAANQCRFMLMLKSDRIGCIDLFDYKPRHGRVGVGVLVDRKYRGKGFAKEAIHLLITFCEQKLKTQMLYADVLSDNTSSIHLFKSVGFKEVGIRKNWAKHDGEYLNQHMFQLTIS